MSAPCAISPRAARLLHWHQRAGLSGLQEMSAGQPSGWAGQSRGSLESVKNTLETKREGEDNADENQQQTSAQNVI